MEQRERISFLDLSIELDRGLGFVAHLVQGAHFGQSLESPILPEFGSFVFEYLGKRVALEHVFFGRSLKNVEIDELKLKAEVWRIQKIKARVKVMDRVRK